MTRAGEETVATEDVATRPVVACGCFGRTKLDDAAAAGSVAAGSIAARAAASRLGPVDVEPGSVAA